MPGQAAKGSPVQSLVQTLPETESSMENGCAQIENSRQVSLRGVMAVPRVPLKHVSDVTRNKCLTLKHYISSLSTGLSKVVFKKIKDTAFHIQKSQQWGRTHAEDCTLLQASTTWLVWLHAVCNSWQLSWKMFLHYVAHYQSESM